MSQLINEAKRFQHLAGIIKESQTLFHRGSDGAQTLMIPNDLGEIDTNDFVTALEFAIDGGMSGRDYEVGEEYNLNVVDQDGDDPTKTVYFKFKQKGEDLEVDPSSIRIETDESLINEAVEVPTWLKGKLEDVHTKPGQGSIFAKSVDDVLKLAQGALDKEQNIDQIANSTGTLTIKSPGIGYNLVLPIEKAKQLPGAQESEVEKAEGPNKVKVPAITTTAPLTQFKTDELTVIVRPKKDESGAVIPNEYIVLSAFPGDPTIPRASEWGGKYAVIIPGKKDIEETVNEALAKFRKNKK